jgi:hypothetical protein
MPQASRYRHDDPSNAPTAQGGGLAIRAAAYPQAMHHWMRHACMLSRGACTTSRPCLSTCQRSSASPRLSPRLSFPARCGRGAPRFAECLARSGLNIVAVFRRLSTPGKTGFSHRWNRLPSAAGRAALGRLDYYARGGRLVRGLAPRYVRYPSEGPAAVKARLKLLLLSRLVALSAPSYQIAERSDRALLGRRSVLRHGPNLAAGSGCLASFSTPVPGGSSSASRLI